MSDWYRGCKRLCTSAGLRMVVASRFEIVVSLWMMAPGQSNIWCTKTAKTSFEKHQKKWTKALDVPTILTFSEFNLFGGWQEAGQRKPKRRSRNGCHDITAGRTWSACPFVITSKTTSRWAQNEKHSTLQISTSAKQHKIYNNFCLFFVRKRTTTRTTKNNNGHTPRTKNVTHPGRTKSVARAKQSGGTPTHKDRKGTIFFGTRAARVVTTVTVRVLVNYGTTCWLLRRDRARSQKTTKKQEKHKQTKTTRTSPKRQTN